MKKIVALLPKVTFPTDNRLDPGQRPTELLAIRKCKTKQTRVASGKPSGLSPCSAPQERGTILLEFSIRCGGNIKKRRNA
jgi:hypothetical protein